MNQDKEFSMGRNEWDSENVSCRAGRLNEQYHRRTAHWWKREITSFPAMCDTTGADAKQLRSGLYMSKVLYPYSYYLGTTSSTIRIPYPYYTEFSLILTWIQLLNTISQFLHESDWNSHCFCRFLRARWWVRITVKRIATG